MRQTLFSALITALTLTPRAAAAQDTPRVGIVMGYPAQVGVLWTVAEKLAIRPELSWTTSSSETPSTFTSFGPGGTTTTVSTSTSDSTTIGIGVSALLYLSTRDALRV